MSCLRYIHQLLLMLMVMDIKYKRREMSISISIDSLLMRHRSRLRGYIIRSSSSNKFILIQSWSHTAMTTIYIGNSPQYLELLRRSIKHPLLLMRDLYYKTANPNQIQIPNPNLRFAKLSMSQVTRQFEMVLFGIPGIPEIPWTFRVPGRHPLRN